MQNKITEQAEALGRDHGKAAAGWVFDDRTSDRTYQTVLQGITDGDPAVLDAIRAPDLSAEHGDDYGSKDLAGDLGIDYQADPEESGLADATAAYLEAVSQAFWDEIERVARDHVGAEGTDG